MSLLLQKCIIREVLWRAAGPMKIAKMCITQKVLYKPRNFDELEKEAENSKSGRKYAIDKVEELLGIRRYTALDLVMQHKKLSLTTGHEMDENYSICMKNSMDNITVIKYPELLAQDDLQTKIDLLRELPFNLNETAPLATLSMYHLKKLLGTPMAVSDTLLRLQTIKQVLNTSTEIICETFVKRPFMKNIGLERMRENINILKKYGITNQDIIKDWWVLQYSSFSLETRLSLAKGHNIEKIKTWMVRGQAQIFDNYVKRRCENKQILGENTLAEYLALRLDCPVELAKIMMLRLPALKNKSMMKLQEIIDLLFSEGIKPVYICRVPKILLHSVTTTRKRIRELSKLGMQMDSLHMLTKSQKQYMQYYEALVKSQKNKVKIGLKKIKEYEEHV